VNAYEKCVIGLKPTLAKKGVDNAETVAQNMCSMWADNNGEEKEFGVSKSDETQRTFAMNFEFDKEALNVSKKDKEDMWEFPVRALTSGRHDYEVDGEEQTVFIEPSILKESLEKFNELPIYYTHQRTPEDLLGKAINPEIEEMEDGKVAISMLAQIYEPTARMKEVIQKVEDGDITNVSVDWFSKDVDVMGDSYATNIRPVEVSFIDNEIATPVCGECTIDTECATHTSEREFATKENCGCDGPSKDVCGCDHDGEDKEVDNMSEEVVKTESEKITEREFASVKKQLEELTSTHSELEQKYNDALNSIEEFKTAEEARKAEEAKKLKTALVNNVVSKELLFGKIQEESKDARTEELFGWEDNKLTGFFEALESMPEPAETEKTFGKGIAKDSEEKAVEAEPEVERMFSMVDGRIRLNRK